MKFSCVQEKLNKGLNTVNRIVSTRGTLPILNNILIQTDKGRLKLSATDLEIGINTWIGAKVEKDGSITVPSRLISDFISTNNDETIDITLNDLTLDIKSKKYEAHIKGLDATDFPLIPEVKKDPLATINSKELRESINTVAFACAIDETRPILNGVLLKFKDKMLKLVATDSYRLAEKIIELNKKIDNEVSVIVPQRTMNELARILTSDEEEIELRIGENQILFSFGDTQLVSRLIEGTFPDYENIIPKKAETKTTLNVKEFSLAIKMASYFARESANNIKIRISKKDKKAEVLAITPQVGDNTSSIEAKVDGKDIEIAFNAKFVLDGLNAIKSEEIVFETIDKLSTGVLRPIKSSDYLYLIMPLRVEE